MPGFVATVNDEVGTIGSVSDGGIENIQIVMIAFCIVSFRVGLEEGRMSEYMSIIIEEIFLMKS